KTKIRVEESIGSFPTDPWVDTFLLCWMTKDELKRWAPHPDWGFVEALLVEYKDVITTLRKGDTPWDPGMLMVGRPIRELEKEWLQWSESIQRHSNIQAGKTE